MERPALRSCRKAFFFFFFLEYSITINTLEQNRRSQHAQDTSRGAFKGFPQTRNAASSMLFKSLPEFIETGTLSS